MRNIVRGQRVTEEKLRRARELRREMTPEECVLWNCIRGQRLGFKFRRQQVIGGYIADFYRHETGLVVEVDGAVHDRQVKEDAHRTEVFGLFGIEVIRFRNDQVTGNLAEVLDRITRKCYEHVAMREEPNPPAPFPGKEGGDRESSSVLSPSPPGVGVGEGLEPKKEAEERGEGFRP